MLNWLRRYWHTLRYLRWQQIAYRLKYALPRAVPRSVGVQKTRIWTRDPANTWPMWMQATLQKDLSFVFLNEAGTLSSPDSWNDPAHSKLWLYNLHYFNDLSAIGAQDRRDDLARLVSRWIKENPSPRGNGWEPYPTSLRIVNWIKWGSTQPDLVEQHWNASLADQAYALNQRLEFHILGNHLFANAKALIFAGAWFQGELAERWMSAGLKILEREILEQFLPDGSHFELSPMYHATMTWDLCDLLMLARLSNLTVLTTQVSKWKRVLKQAMVWLNFMTHPDGEVAFFNDSAMGAAPRYADLKHYAELFLDVEVKERSVSDFDLFYAKSSGYCQITAGPAALFIDVADVGPKYLPGHAHADTLSFELSLHGQRLFVNSGISVYGEGSLRRYQRSTPAHNTVVINGEDSSETWAGFRVARRAQPINIKIQKYENSIQIEAAHNGYLRLPGKNIHHRCWMVTKNTLQIADSIEGKFNHALAFFHLHPSVEAEMLDGEGQVLELRVSNGHVARMKVRGGAVSIGAGYWYPEFGLKLENKHVILNAQDASFSIEISWDERF